MSLQELEKFINGLNLTEKAYVWDIISRELIGEFPNIDKHPAILGGEAHIIRTRIPVWILVNLRDLGMSDADILASYPTLRLDDLRHAWVYADSHIEEIRSAIISNEMA